MVFSNLRSSIRRWSKVRQTVSELEQMSDRELSDIGITRWQIRDVAAKSVL